jgi:putative DNA primase/helicase
MEMEALWNQCEGRWPGILRTLGLPEDLLSKKAMACPFCGGDDRFKFTDHEGKGLYFCRGCGPGNGVTLAGKVLDEPVSEIIRRILEILGAGGVKAASKPRRSPGKAQAARMLEKSSPLKKGDPVCLYLGGRGLRKASQALLYNKSAAAGKSRKMPSMVAPVTGVGGEVVGLHLTHLERSGKLWRKAEMDTPKRCRLIGETISGGAVRLGDPCELLGLTEGIETALAVHEDFGVRCWAALGTSGITGWQPPEGVRRVVVFADHDASHAGQLAAYRLASRLEGEGTPCIVLLPDAPGDFLDSHNRAPVPRAVDWMEILWERRKGGQHRPDVL